MITCTRRIEFDAGHRIPEHENKCKYLHGHRYVIEATFQSGSLDPLGRVIDFGAIRDLLGKWIDEHWDHTTILHDTDRDLGEAITNHTGQKIFYMRANPTAENMAGYLLGTVCPDLFQDKNATCIRIKLYETPNCYAEAAAG
jgi:6-pyruvoyltetrahydropterin/6-carboxytetrahydropterin synthase